METVRMIAGITMVTMGFGLVLTSLYRLFAAQLQGLLETGGAKSPQILDDASQVFSSEDQVSDKVVKEEAPSTKSKPIQKTKTTDKVPASQQPQTRFEKAGLQKHHVYRDIPLKQSGRDQHYDLEALGGMIAWLVYSRLNPGTSGRVGSVLKQSMFTGSRIDKPARLYGFSWVRLFVDESVLQAIRSYYNLNQDELDTTVKKHLVAVMDGFLEPGVRDAWSERLVLNLFSRNRRGDTVFDLDFLPLIGPGEVTSDAHIVLGSSVGEVRVPYGPEHAKFNYADRQLSLSHGYLPLDGPFAHYLEIGSDNSCHVQTRRRILDGTLAIGWRATKDVEYGGYLEIHHTQLNKETGSLFLRHNSDSGVEIPLEAGTRAGIAENEEGTSTQVDLLIRNEGEEHILATIVLRERKPVLSELPDCAFFPTGFERIKEPADLIRLLASRIYFATKTGRNQADHFFLEDPEATNFLEHPDQGRIFKANQEREPLRHQVHVCVAPNTKTLFHEWLGDSNVSQKLAKGIIELISSDTLYQQAFPGDTHDAFLAGEGTPGLQVHLSSDHTLNGEALLIRCLPVFKPNRRREIYGRLHFESWKGAMDNTGFSCQEGVTYLTDHPPGQVGLHLSRFPIYDIEVPKILGALKIQLFDPGGRRAMLNIKNQSATAVYINDKPLNLASDFSLSIDGINQEISIRVSGTEAGLLLYGTPVVQMDETHFVPEPARLELYGPTLHRRLDRTAWKSSDVLTRLWNHPESGENKSLLGVVRTGPKTWLATIERDLQIERHLLTADGCIVDAGDVEQIPAGSSTLRGKGLPARSTHWEPDHTNITVDTHLFDLNRDRIGNLKLLTEDYYDLWFEDIEPLLPENERITRIEAARFDMDRAEDLSAHLYLVETVSEQNQMRKGWIFQPEGGVTTVKRANSLDEAEPNDSEALKGPFEVENRLYQVDWCGEPETLVSFDIDDHLEQIKAYIADGYFTFKENMAYGPGGKVSGEMEKYARSEPMFLTSKPLHLSSEAPTGHGKECLNFDPRQYANFFDKDSYKIFYSGTIQSFVVSATPHRKTNITPKTVFMVVPEGGRAILGSHALPPVKIPAGTSRIVFPGLTFSFSQGPVYYA